MHDLILQYEYDFFIAEFCNNIENLEKRICLNFVEYGQSGNVYTRSEVIDFLLNMKNDRDVDILDFSKEELCEGVFIVHYVSYEKLYDRYARRTSIWKKEDDCWKILFHQGTICSCPL
ncbi:MAG: hypothetical protein Q8873_06710 [Bacillota bacterium]|nr:hypothetical protein [Bacillota bacterium]